MNFGKSDLFRISINCINHAKMTHVTDLVRMDKQIMNKKLTQNALGTCVIFVFCFASGWLWRVSRSVTRLQTQNTKILQIVIEAKSEKGCLMLLIRHHCQNSFQLHKIISELKFGCLRGGVADPKHKNN